MRRLPLPLRAFWRLAVARSNLGPARCARVDRLEAWFQGISSAGSYGKGAGVRGSGRLAAPPLSPVAPSQPYVERAGAAVAWAGLLEAEHDRAQVGLAQPMRDETA